MTRLSRDEWALGLAWLCAKRATCLRRSVGCVLLDVRGHVLATGYNGVASGMPHCNHLDAQVACETSGLVYSTYPHACPGATSASGTNLDGCQAIHAEQNALLQCRDPWAIDTAYCTTAPCMTCTKLFLNTSCRRIVFDENYPHTEARDLWTRSGRLWEQKKVYLPGDLR